MWTSSRWRSICTPRVWRRGWTFRTSTPSHAPWSIATSYPSTRATSEAQAWQALKTLGDAALAQGGLQAVLQMFVGTLTGAEEVARVSEEAGHPESLTPEVVAQWISTDYVPGMQQALPQTPGGAEQQGT